MATSGSFQSDSYSISGKWRGEIKCDWSSEPTDTPGKTKVNWTLTGIGRTGFESGSLYTIARVVINGTEVWSVNNKLLSYKNKKLENGTFEVSHKPDGEGTFDIEIYMTKKYNHFGSEVCYSSTIFLDTNYPYTNCYWDSGAMVTISQPYIAPQGMLKLEWPYANAGIGVDINGYQVQYKIGSEEWADTIFQSLEDNKYEINLGELNIQDNFRGQPIYIRVKAKSNPEGYDSSYLQSSASYINIQPSKPVINNYSGKDTENIVGYETTEIEINYSLPKKTTNQTLSAEFNIGEGWKPLSGNITWPDGAQEVTLQIRSNDGVESTETEAIILQKNTENVKDYVFEIQGFILSVNMPDTSSTAAEKFGGYFGELTITTKGQISSISFTSDYSNDIRCLVPYLLKSKEELNIEIKVSITDGVDFNTVTQSCDIEVPEILLSPTGLQESEQIERYFDKKITVIIPQDQIDWKAKSASYEFNVNEGEEVKQITLSDSSEKYEFQVQASNSLTQIYNLPLDLKINDSANFYKPYTEVLSLNGTIPNDLAEYGLAVAPELVFWFDEKNKSESYNFFNGSSSDIINYSISRGDSYKIAEPFVGNLVVGKNLYYEYTTIFGTSHIIKASKAITLDFRELARWGETSKWLNCEDIEISQWDCILEGMKLSISGHFGSFSKPQIIKLQYLVGTEGWIDIGEIQAMEVENSGTGFEDVNTQPTIYNFSGQTLSIGKIIEDQKVKKIRLLILTNHPEFSEVEVDYSNNPLQFKRHVPTQIYFTSLNYVGKNIEANFALEYGYDTDFFADNMERELYGIVQNQEEELVGAEVDYSNYSAKFAYNFNELDYIYLAPRLKTTLSTKAGSQTYSHSITNSESEYLICYNISPTISYRQNHIGINTNQIDGDEYKDAIAIISQYNNRGKICFSGVNNGTSLSSTLDLTTMGLIGFVVDCGSWDNTPGGIIPGGGSGDIPTGLAAIAYSGEIGDLEQEREDIIIFVGGSAPIEI